MSEQLTRTTHSRIFKCLLITTLTVTGTHRFRKRNRYGEFRLFYTIFTPLTITLSNLTLSLKIKTQFLTEQT